MSLDFVRVEHLRYVYMTPRMNYSKAGNVSLIKCFSAVSLLIVSSRQCTVAEFIVSVSASRDSSRVRRLSVPSREGPLKKLTSVLEHRHLFLRLVGDSVCNV